MGRLHNVGPKVVHRLRRWPNSEPTLETPLVFTGAVLHMISIIAARGSAFDVRF